MNKTTSVEDSRAPLNIIINLIDLYLFLFLKDFRHVIVREGFVNTAFDFLLLLMSHPNHWEKQDSEERKNNRLVRKP